jgi:hypothetical protein
LKNKSVSKSDLPIHLSEEKQTSIEPQIQFLYKCIAELPETERIIISLELEEVKQSEIAKIVGLSEANVRVKIHRIKEKLTKNLKKMDNDNNIDFKDLWKKQSVSQPDMKDLLSRVSRFKKQV